MAHFDRGVYEPSDDMRVFDGAEDDEDVEGSRLPLLIVLADPTTGGVSASFAMLGDIAIAEPGAIIGFAGARVIEETIKQELPEGFQRSEFLLRHGMVDRVVDRRAIPDEKIHSGSGDGVWAYALPASAISTMQVAMTSGLTGKAFSGPSQWSASSLPWDDCPTGSVAGLIGVRRRS